MNLINNFLEQEFKIIIYKNKINIINYDDISSITEDEIYLNYKEGLIKIKGKMLSINKMIDHEILISGEIKEVKLI
jgi:sporulation protein YqfC